MHIALFGSTGRHITLARDPSRLLLHPDLTLKAGRVSRADVADFLLRQLSEDTFQLQAPAVT